MPSHQLLGWNQFPLHGAADRCADIVKALQDACDDQKSGSWRKYKHQVGNPEKAEWSCTRFGLRLSAFNHRRSDICVRTSHDRYYVKMVATNKAPSLEHPVIPNRFDRMEWAGAFSDLGTLTPFVVAYMSFLKRGLMRL